MLRRAVLILALLSIAGPSFADSFHVTAVTCQNCFSPSPILPSHTIDAVVTVVPGTGTFWDAFFQAPISANGLLEVTAINGLVDGIHPITLMTGNQGDGRSWLFPGGQPGLVWFNIAGFDMRVFNDHAFNLLQDRESPGYMQVPQVPLLWTATVAEPSSFVSIVTGLGCFVALAQRLRRSDH
jgi:hypothetical protein